MPIADGTKLRASRRIQQRRKTPTSKERVVLVIADQQERTSNELLCGPKERNKETINAMKAKPIGA